MQSVIRGTPFGRLLAHQVGIEDDSLHTNLIVERPLECLGGVRFAYPKEEKDFQRQIRHKRNASPS